MTTREFMMHLIMNCEPNSPVTIEARVNDRIVHLQPSHAFGIGDDCGEPETVIECKPAAIDFKEEAYNG